MSNSDASSVGPNTVILGVLGATVLYMIWIGVSGAPIPEWVYWISTIL